MKAGRPIGSQSGRKISLALAEAAIISEHTKRLEILVTQMSDRQQKLFQSLAKGRNDLEAIVESQLYEYITGVAKIVYTAEGRPMRTASIRTIKDLSKLSPESYERLSRLARSAVVNNVGQVENLGKLADGIRWFLQLVAPEAARSIIRIMFDGKSSDSLKIKAAIEILNRAGYGVDSNGNTEEPMPIKINMVTADPVTLN